MKKLFMVAGESSGDLQGSVLVKSLLEKDPTLQINALGGPLMERAGATIVADLTGHAVVGLVEGIRNVSRIYSTFRQIVNLLKADKPDALILIDYPEFNLRLAKKAKKLGIPVLYYISPQVWAWRQWRVKTIRKYVDKMFVIFPFEEDYFRRHGIDADFVGHPLVDRLAGVPSREQARQDLGIGPDELVIGILPGSRSKEFEAIFPVMQQASGIIQEKTDRPIRFLCAHAPALDKNQTAKLIAASDAEINVVDNDTYRVIRAADLTLTASGTATVETMILGTPMIVVYIVSRLTYALFIRLMKVDLYAMVNIIAQKEVVPEFIQSNATPQNIADKALYMLRNGHLKEMATELAELTNRLKQPDNGRPDSVASGVAAKILEYIDGRSC